MTFKATEAATEGFRIIGREPGTVATWAAASIVTSLVMFGAMYLTGFTRMIGMGSTQAAANPMQFIGAMFGFVAIVMVVALIAYSVIICAVYRAVLRPAETGFGRLRLGGDEGRMLGLMFILWLLAIAVYVVIIIVGVILAVIFGASMFAAGGANSGSGPPPAGIILFAGLFYVLILGAMLVFAVQFSMAAPMTFATRRLSVFSSMKLVKGNFWRLFGCYVLVFLMSFALYLVLMIIQLTLAAAVGAPSFLTAFTNPAAAQDVSRVFSPAAIGVSLVTSALGVIFYPIWFAPAAAAYRDITGSQPSAQARVFE